jgi:hypothetical protein
MHKLRTSIGLTLRSRTGRPAGGHSPRRGGVGGRPQLSQSGTSATIYRAVDVARSIAMPGTFRIGNIAGINIDIHMSWIIILVLLTVSLATGWFPQLYQGWSTATY